MASKLMTTNELRGTRVVGGKKKTKRIGKVRRFVFHPRERRVVGFIVKRPDLLWMFHRKDLFVSLAGFDMVDGRVAVHNSADATGKGACKALGVDWDACVLWEGMPILTESGTALGTVGSVSFDPETGAIAYVVTDEGMTANKLLGTRRIPASMIKGFRRGIGTELAPSAQAGAEQDDDQVELGAILVSDEAAQLAAEGSAAEKAGAATAVAVDKVNRTVKPAVNNAAKKTTEAAGKGARALGKRALETKDALGGFKEEYDKARGVDPARKAQDSQLSAEPQKATYKTMFSSFKKEYDKARRDDD